MPPFQRAESLSATCLAPCLALIPHDPARPQAPTGSPEEVEPAFQPEPIGPSPAFQRRSATPLLCEAVHAAAC